MAFAPAPAARRRIPLHRSRRTSSFIGSPPAGAEAASLPELVDGYGEEHESPLHHHLVGRGPRRAGLKALPDGLQEHHTHDAAPDGSLASEDAGPSYDDGRDGRQFEPDADVGLCRAGAARGENAGQSRARTREGVRDRLQPRRRGSPPGVPPGGCCLWRTASARKWSAPAPPPPMTATAAKIQAVSLASAKVLVSEDLVVGVGHRDDQAARRQQRDAPGRRCWSRACR